MSEANNEFSGASDILSSLTLDLKPIGHLCGPPQTLTRNISIRRALTLNPKPCMSQVVIRNTQSRNVNIAGTPQTQSTSSLPIVRSQSLMSPTANVPTLAPRRSERSNLEFALSDVWSKDILPVPGMGLRRSDNPIRASANTVMRKLSMASLSVTRRASQKEQMPPMSTVASKPALSQAKSERKLAIPKIDFQHSPERFLPPDFEPENLKVIGRKKSWFWK